MNQESNILDFPIRDPEKEALKLKEKQFEAALTKMNAMLCSSNSEGVHELVKKLLEDLKGGHPIPEDLIS